VIEMGMMKHCPKCGSAHVSPLVFYRPSVWRCLDCGYEGALIIEGGAFAEIVQERYRSSHNILDWIGGKPRLNNCGVTIEDSGYVELRL
jgi:ribosomal protein L37AE/L43A